MLATLEDSDPKIWVSPARLSRRAHARAVTSDHNQSLMRHSGAL